LADRCANYQQSDTGFIVCLVVLGGWSMR
jgi:hypothetical protein